MNRGLFGWSGSGSSAIHMVDKATGIVPTSNTSYALLANITDGDDSTIGSALTTDTPQYVQVFLVIPATIYGTRISFRDAAHTSVNGALQYSLDGVTYQAAMSWTGDGRVDRSYSFDPVAAPYWRLNTTRTGSPGGTGIDIYTWSLFGP